MDTFYVCLALKGADTMSSMKINKNLAASIGFVIAVSVLPLSVRALPECGTVDRCETAAISCQTNGGAWNGTAGTCQNPSATPSSETGTRETIDITGASAEITELINNILKIIYALSGFSIIGMVILGGIQYSSSNGNPQAVSSAKKKIQGAVLALVVLALLYPFLQWIIPGGSFN